MELSPLSVGLTGIYIKLKTVATITQVYNYANEILDAFEQGMQKSSASIYSGLVSQIKALEVNEEGIIVFSSANKKAIFQFYGTMLNRLDTNVFNQRTTSMLEAIPLLGDTMIEAYVDTFGDLGDDLSIIYNVQATATGYKNGIDISAGAVNEGVFLPLLDEIYFAVGGGATIEQILNLVKTKLSGALDRFFKTKVHTTVFNALRQIQTQLDDWYGNNLFLFIGPKDSKNRDWCHGKAGKRYTKAAIQAWPAEEWEGKIPGTTGTTIFTNLGGFNCRHWLKPVRK